MEPKPTALVNAAPPYGHVVCSEKWRTSSLLQGLKEAGLKVLFENELAVADFLLPNKVCLLYVSEGDMVAGNGFRRKLVRYRNASSSFQQLVLAERTRLSEQYFSALQKFVVLDLGLSLLPVGGQTEASQLITQIVHGEGRENPFRRRTSCRLLDSITLALVQQIPGVGKVRAVTLMQNFPSIQEISNASPAELEPLVGQASAQQIHSFFHAHLTPGN
ncbi:Fanconi anemia core complex-associated protein 24 [Cyprinodon tularosa]|uniref:Fanconi anemia core complex-associated protein 24 n=1 Tax=Cyprinodon tularosa TaxID=77115 RepID=UPI0018E1FA86|nr:Fanconi anemia core complex-associated protein 24 [Cyprinodon tularosa]